MTEEETKMRDRIAEALFVRLFRHDSDVKGLAANCYNRADTFVAARDEGDDPSAEVAGNVGGELWTRYCYVKTCNDHLSDRVETLEQALAEARDACGEEEVKRSGVPNTWHDRFWRLAGLLRMPGSPSFHEVYDAMRKAVNDRDHLSDKVVALEAVIRELEANQQSFATWKASAITRGMRIDHLIEENKALEETLTGTRQAFDDVSATLMKARARVVELEGENERLLERLAKP